MSESDEESNDVQADVKMNSKNKRKREPQASPTGEWKVLGTESWNCYDKIFNSKTKIDKPMAYPGKASKFQTNREFKKIIN
ncbi:MAG: hypothetical protein EZS28_003227 [Streblomastix strix]|uniref:Uncharacterized protein n=1 Tax=Streblomastix strix TaxID=222440 RepID=A0A5J4X3L9_9EUKA|nr:MAG: hypothetical protein EZS28_003227 [Streblomastix strix]